MKKLILKVIVIIAFFLQSFLFSCYPLDGKFFTNSDKQKESKLMDFSDKLEPNLDKFIRFDQENPIEYRKNRPKKNQQKFNLDELTKFIRQTEETLRQTKEKDRQTKEKDRQTEESFRQTEESFRQIEESIRKMEELSRQKEELFRQKEEILRQNSRRQQRFLSLTCAFLMLGIGIITIQYLRHFHFIKISA